MYLKRDHLIRKQIIQNKKSLHYQDLQGEVLQQLQTSACAELSLQKINSREIDYYYIDRFLILATDESKTNFYERLKNDLKNIFQDEKCMKTFENKWSSILKSNVMKLFNNIARQQDKYRRHFTRLYTETILKLIYEDKLSRVEEKFLDAFLVQQMRHNRRLDVLGNENLKIINKQAKKIFENLVNKEVSRTALSNCQFLQYAILSLLKHELPHQKYLSNQLIHAPNPKFLLPFRKKGTFVALTNQILLKLNKIDMVGINYWSYYPYEECDIYEKTRKAAGWQNKVQILLLLIKSKLADGLLRYLNLINQKAMIYGNRQITQDGINSLNSYVQISLEICRNKKNITEMESALQRIDLSHTFQQKSLNNEPKLKQFMLKLIELYLILLAQCNKKNLRYKFLRNLAINICILLENHNEQKFKLQCVAIVSKALKELQNDQVKQFLFSTLQFINQEWQEKQKILLNNEIAKIDPEVVSFLANLVSEFGLEDHNNPDYKMLKLQFFYIMALNYKENSYIQSKKLLSKVNIDIQNSLNNSEILTIHDTKKSSHQMFRKHLRALYGQYDLHNPEHEGLLAVIDEIVTYRIQALRDNPHITSYEQTFYALMVNLIEKSQRIDSSGKMLDIVKKYFIKCKKTYLIDTIQMKYRDESKIETCKVITEEICYLIEGSASSNPIIAQFCQQSLMDHIQAIPQLAFFTRIIVVFCQCISALYRKQSQQYESKAQRIKGKNLTQSILIPTDNKDVIKRLIKLMSAMYQIILRAHCIDDSYLRVRCQHLIRQNTKSAQINFGWKYLKHLLSSFKQDKQFIAKEILNNNSCSWFINESYFSQKLNKLRPQKILLDSNLIPLHRGTCTKQELKKIFNGVEPQQETQFLIVPLKQTGTEVQKIIMSLEYTCNEIQHAKIYQTKNQAYIKQKQQELYDIISRVKMVYLTKTSTTTFLSKILQTCQKFNNPDLLKYIYRKILPFFYCLKEFNVTFLAIIAQFLYRLVLEINTVSKLNIEKRSCSSQEEDTFNISLNCFQSVNERQYMEQTQKYYELMQKYIGKVQRIRRYMIIQLHKQRFYSLERMYMNTMRFLSSHFHVMIAQGLPLLKITQAFSTSFLLEPQAMEYLSLQSISYCLTSHFELVNVLKSSLEIGQTLYDQSLIDEFYCKSLKLGLFHFSKKNTLQKIQLHTQSRNIKSMKKKIDFFIRICDYLRNDDFHKLSKKKLPKRNQIFTSKLQHKKNPLLTLLEFNKPPNKILKTQSKLQKMQIRNYQSMKIPSMKNRNSANNNATHQIFYDFTVMRYTLLYLISQQIDKIKAYSFTELGEIKNPYSLAAKKKFINNEMIQKLLVGFEQTSAILVFYILKIFHIRIQDPEIIRQLLTERVCEYPDYGFPDFLDMFIDANKGDKTKITQINYWKTQNIQVLFKYLTKQYEQYPYLQLYVTKVLSRLSSTQILFYLPQIFQALTLKTGKIIYQFLLDYARKSACFAHQLIWIAKVQSKQQKDPHNKNPRLPGVDENLQKLQKIAKKLIKDVIRHFTREQKSFFRQVDDFYEEVTAVSGKMIPSMSSAEKKQKIKQEVAKINMPKSVYLPINPIYQVVSINRQSGTPMQSAAKCPFLLTFNCKQYCGPDKYFQNLKKSKRKQINKLIDLQLEDIRQEEVPQMMPDHGIVTVGSRYKKSASRVQNSRKSSSIGEGKSQNEIVDLSHINFEIRDQMKKKTITQNKSSNLMSSKKYIGSLHQQQQTTQVSCIFKVFDDIRQDCLALQVIRLFKEIFQRHNIQLKLFPYKTISNRTGDDLNIGGIIEVVPKTVSRDSIGKTNQESLYEFFINNFGPQYNINFQEARQNFIRSQAAYSVVSYILQIKDRHNGNILINKEQGYLVHIDFGFIFDISPANNLRFERADFKLTDQMIKIMGGKIDSEPFQLYLNLVIKGFLIARRYQQHIRNIITQMYYSGLPCFLEKSLQNLKNRFMLDMSEIEAAEQMKKIVMNSADHWTTIWYDKIQWMQQKIYH